MIYISEEESANLITHELASDAVREAFAAASDADSFPAVFGHGARITDRVSIKAATDQVVCGVKIGSYWPDNEKHGRARHSSFIVLLDQDSGRVAAAIEARAVNGYRTAAADAVAASALARPDSAVLTIFGSGRQARYECAALCRIFPISMIHVVARRPRAGSSMVDELTDQALPAQMSDPETACRSSDIIVTATSGREPLFSAGWIRPGTHVAAMGADGTGKRELPLELLRTARLFCDLPAQSVAIGEFQHVANLVRSGEAAITAIGDVLTGRAPGRRSPTDVTIFDSSGIALQDLYVARALVTKIAERRLLNEAAPPLR